VSSSRLGRRVDRLRRGARRGSDSSNVAADPAVDHDHVAPAVDHHDHEAAHQPTTLAPITTTSLIRRASIVPPPTDPPTTVPTSPPTTEAHHHAAADH
jgi:hypothetical protein